MNKKKSLKVNSEELHGLAPDFIESKAVFQVDALKVVKNNDLLS